MTDDLHKRDAVTLANSRLIDWLNEEAECEIASAGELTTLGKKLRAMEVTARRLVRDNAALLARLEAVTQERDELDGANILNRNALKRCQASAEKAEAALAVAGQNAANIARSFSCCHVPQEIAAEILAQIEERGE